MTSQTREAIDAASMQFEIERSRPRYARLGTSPSLKQWKQPRRRSRRKADLGIDARGRRRSVHGSTALAAQMATNSFK